MVDITSCVIAVVVFLWLLMIGFLLLGIRDKRYTLLTHDPDVLVPSKNKPKVSVIIPARNEAANIGACIGCVISQDYDNYEVILVDDNSTDGTGRIVQEKAKSSHISISVIGCSEPKEGWLGKPNACWTGYKQAKGSLFLFIDADVRLAPFALRRVVEEVISRSLDGASLFGTWTLGSFWERVAQPVVGGFVRGAHPLDRINDPKQPMAFANGQFIMIKRESYEKVEGHVSVASQVLEDVAFATVLKKNNQKLGMFLAPEFFDVRLYHGLGELFWGYAKNFYAGMNRRWFTALIAALFVFGTTQLPFLTAIAALIGGYGSLTILSLGAIALMYSFRAIQDRQTGLQWRYTLTHPLGALVLIAIICTSAWRGLVNSGTKWKGRNV